MALRMAVILFSIMVMCFPAAGKVCDCQIGSLPQTFQSNSVNDSGVFFNLDSPATCSGEVSALQGCYYPPTCEQNSTIDFGIWRPFGNGTYYIIPNSTLSFQLIQPQVSYQFLCQKWNFPGGRAIPVEEGDIIGIRSVGAGEETGCHFLRAGLTGFTAYQLAFSKEVFDRMELTTRVGYGFYVTADVDIGSTGSSSTIIGCNITPSSVYGFSPTPISTNTGGFSPTPIATNTITSRGSILPLWLIFILVVVGCVVLAMTLVLIGVLYKRLKRCSPAVKTRGRRTVQNEVTLMRRPTLLGDIPSFSDEDIPLNAFDAVTSGNRMEKVQQQMVDTVSATIFTNVVAELTDEEPHLDNSTDTNEILQAGKDTSAAQQSFQFPVDESTEDISSPQPRISVSTPSAFRRSLSEGTLVELHAPAAEEPSYPADSDTSPSSIRSTQQFVHNRLEKSNSFPRLPKEPSSPRDYANTSPGQPPTCEAQPYIDLVPVDSYAYARSRPLLKPSHYSPTDSGAGIPSHSHSEPGTRQTTSPNPDMDERIPIDFAHYEDIGLGVPSSSIQGNEQYNPQLENSHTRNRKQAITTPLYLQSDIVPAGIAGCVNRPASMQRFNEPSPITFPQQSGQNMGASSSQIGPVAAQEPPMTEEGEHGHDNVVPLPPPPPPPPRRQDRKEEGDDHFTQDSAMPDSLRYTPVFV